MTSSCSKCHRLFIPPPSNTQGDTLCFECLPRVVTGVETKQKANGAKRRSSRRIWTGRSGRRADAIEKMRCGGALFVIGAVVTFCTYAFANVTGGFYLLAWGPLVFGGVRFAIGVLQFLFD